MKAGNHSPLWRFVKSVDAGDGASKTDMTATLGHEVLETQSLQGKGGGLFGANSEQVQEALGNAFGEQLASRINQAAGGDLDATDGSYFATGLKQSQAVLNGTVKANQVGTATVDHRQLYVQEASAILKNAPAYAERHGITETQAKKELIQQALLMVDRGWAEQTHITENDRARQALEAIAEQQTDKARDALTRTPFNQVVHRNESDYFQADETAYNDSNLNAAEASAIEAGWAGEDNVLSRYGTDNGEKPLQVGFSDSASQLGSNARQGVGAFYDAATTDPLGLAVDTVNNVYEDVVSCLTTSQCIAPDQTHGTARDRQLAAELQGNADAAVAEAADSLGTTLGELAAVPGLRKVAKTGVAELVDTAADQARRNARDWADDAKPARIPANKDVSPGLDVDGEMIGQDGPTYSGVRETQDLVPSSASGIANLTERGTLTNLRPGDTAILQNTLRTLVQDSSGRYWLQGPSGNRITPSGSYDFVTSPDGTIRVARPNSNPDFSTHLGLSGGGEVNYAGSIRFSNNRSLNRGTITEWSNNSGHYQPPAPLMNNANLPVDLFSQH